MQAVILAAGESSRFYPYNSFGHKSLVVLGGKTLIEYTVENLRRAGVSEIIIVEGKNRFISKALAHLHDLTFIIQENPQGMGDALLTAKDVLAEQFLVVNSYHFEAGDFLHEMESSAKNPADIVLLTKEEKDPSAFGTFEKKDGKLVVSEKKQGENLDRIVGLYLLNKKFIEVLEQEPKEHYNFESAISTYSNTHEIILLKTDKTTLSLKYPWDLLSVKDYLLEKIEEKISEKAKVSDKAVISGKVSIEEGATVMEGAVITGPAYIGKNAYVGTNSVMRGGVCVEEGAVVGSQMELKNTILMRGATTHAGFIGDSTVGEETKMAAGFTTANVRLDRKEISVHVKGQKISTHRKSFGTIIGSGCSFGIRVGTMPGVMVGNNVIVGPGTTVMEDLEDNITFYTEFEKHVTKHK
ncbi:MAG: sugar phosphate nucleotidyltransferase [Candidatus Levyibacteriota bacterium]